jgi:FdhD protein
MSSPQEQPDKPPSPETTDMTEAAGLTLEWPIRRYHGSGEQTTLRDIVVREQRIWLVLNGTPLLAMLALPRDVEALALGFLVSEGLWRDRERLPEVRFDASSSQVECLGDFNEQAVRGIHRQWTFGTGCGGGGTARDLRLLGECRPLESSLTIRVSQLVALGRELRRRGHLHRMTGGVHACGIADPDRILLFAEDVGRHNAFDKVAGMALQSGMDMSQKIALTTGRLSVEIVSKAVAHGVPILASLSAPTALGVRWARRFALTLVGFLRGEHMNVYTGYHRVVPDDG